MNNYKTIVTFDNGEELNESIAANSASAALRAVLADLTGEDAKHLNGTPCLRKIPGVAVTKRLEKAVDSVSFDVFTQKPCNYKGQRFWETLLAKGVKMVKIIGAADAAHLLGDEDFNILVHFAAKNA